MVNVKQYCGVLNVNWMNYEIDSVLKTQVSCLTGVDKPRPF